MSFNALDLMAQAAGSFRDRLRAEPGCAALPLHGIVGVPDGLQWDNTLLRSETYRRAHVETFVAEQRLSVLHVCVFPCLRDPGPIFGFDVVAGPARVTGMFLDLSPVTSAPPRPRLRDVADPARFAVRRPAPAWGGIFSDDFLAVRPSGREEVAMAIDMGLQALDRVLRMAGRADAAAEDIAAGQARYVRGQRQNEHTFRMLAAFVGSHPARRFIDEVLFPLDDLASQQPA